MNTETLKAIALLQHLEQDFFIFNDIAYMGTRAEAEQEFEDYIAEGNSSITFDEYCTNHLTEVEDYNENDYNNDYMVLTGEEADKMLDEELENYIDECILPELNESYRQYFDNEAWKADARHGGRGHSLGRYDGEENEETVSDDLGKYTYYIYRQK